MKTIATLLLAVLATTVVVGCSDSSSPTTTYPLTLNVVYHVRPISTDTFQFQVLKDGQPFKGADIKFITSPYYTTTDLNIKTDSLGLSPKVGIFFRFDSVQKAAFQAYKDTLVSNYYYFVPGS